MRIAVTVCVLLSSGCWTLMQPETCGDGFIFPGVEECDDGNGSNTDHCLTDCRDARCGDGFVRDGLEGCDDGNDDPTDSCSNYCQPRNCGDGVVQAGEQCDHANGGGCLDDCNGHGFQQLALGKRHTCGLLRGGTVRCWGYNESGQLGDGSTTNRPRSVAVLGLSNVSQISLGADHSCALVNDDRVRCWGKNSSGQLGNSGTRNVASPVVVDPNGDGNMRQISLGAYHSCALLDDDTVRCWGQNEYGQLGDRSNTNRNSPVGVEQQGNVSQISLGANHSCARAGRWVYCWGANTQGQLGYGTTASNVPYPSMHIPAINGDVSHISLGADHNCMLLDDGTVRCWGFNQSGQLGDGSTINRVSHVAVSGLGRSVSQISLGDDHSCALLGDGDGIDDTVRCWGENEFGQLGDGSNTNRNRPVPVPGLTNVSQISLGGDHSCALLNDDTVRCWGQNEFGQLGDGSTMNRNSP